MADQDGRSGAYLGAREAALSWRASRDPGIEVRPLHQMNGEHGFNEVFFTSARVDDDRVIGEPGGGWSAAVTVLMYERFMASLPSAVPGRKAGQKEPRSDRDVPFRDLTIGTQRK